MTIELDRKGLKILVRGSHPNYNAFNNPLVKKAGHYYSDQHGKTSWDNLSVLTDEELYALYEICRNSWFNGDELQKCKDSPVYFYNKYVRKEGQKELTEAEYEDFVKRVEYQRNMPLKLRSDYKDRPLTPGQCYKRLPDFLKNSD